MNKQDMIDDIMDNFDFDNVAAVMCAMDWQWVDVGVPTTFDARKTVRLLLKEAYSRAYELQEPCSVSTGGFKATAHFKNGCVEGMELVFAISEWDVWDD